MWRDQMDLAGFRCVVFDQRGFGQTPWASGSYADWRDALEVLDHLQIESAVVVGCSLGGGIAMHLALSVPERVDGMVLIGAATRGWEPKDGWTEIPEVDEAEAASAAGDVERVLELEAAIWLAGLGRSLDDIDPSLVKLFIEMDRIPAVTEVERNRHVESFDPPTNERLDDINAPTLIMVGAYDLAEMLESARYLAVRLSDQPAIVVEDAAHLPSLEQPDRVNKALLAFLNSRVRS
jgi:pimeloyl-ACP methyl ester carboxylesterase